MFDVSQSCQGTGSSNPDVVGIGVLGAFSASAFISLLIAFYYIRISDGGSATLWDVSDSDIDHSLSPQELERSKKLTLMNNIMLDLSDGQMLLGIALLLAALVQIKSLGLHHLHLIYDTASFTAISFWVSFSAACGYKKKPASNMPEPVSPPSRRRARLFAVLLYTTIHVTFSMQFIWQLNSWNDSVDVDQFYVFTTTFMLAVVLIAMIIYLIVMEQEEQEGHIKPHPVAYIKGCAIKVFTLLGLFSALTQFWVHLYMMVALRYTNRNLLADSGENQWGFGQSIAVIMLLSTIRDCLCAFHDYYVWKTKVLPKIIIATEHQETSKSTNPTTHPPELAMCLMPKVDTPVRPFTKRRTSLDLAKL
ncbi:hypothetical protein EJ08DRAFT_660506 [Tothia fuscella]|uniref:Uncharacterized protein n=1 Tax=Tothia fuscella TaxID=1048955 RepID=A0A9P4NT51_9PEZI|nr:hypothetical protein EJ08DRAFT_660506 [Tothia fuscella]